MLKCRFSKGIGSAVRRALGTSSARRTSSFTSVEQFTKRQAGTVDVWWLYDDGGNSYTLHITYALALDRVSTRAEPKYLYGCYKH